MKSFTIFHKLFTTTIFILLLTIDLTAANSCSSTTNHLFSESGTNATFNDSYSGNKFDNGDTEFYYFQIPSAGKLIFNHASSSSTSYKYHLSSCPSGSVGTTLTNGNEITFNGSEDFNLRIRAGANNQTYNFTLTFVPDTITYQESADDICYDDYQLSGMMCTSFGGMFCTTTFPIRNISNENLSNVQIVHNEDGMTGSFASGCSVSPSGTCSEEEDFDMGPFGMFGNAVTFNFDSAITPTQTTASISTTSMMSMNFFTTTSLYATYQKDGVYYRGAMSKCPEVSSGGRDFEIRNPPETRNIKGNLKVIGNTVLCYKGSGSTCQATTSPNEDLYLKYIDIDGVSGTYNSSKAEITGIPASATIKWAGLYTQGFMGINQADTIAALNAAPVILTTPNGTNLELIPEVIDVHLYESNRYSYSTYNHLSQLEGLKGSDVNGWFTGANIKATEGNGPNPGYFGAWSLVLVYEDQSESLKNISVFDGYKRVSSENAYKNVYIDVSGFLTPTSGDVASTLSLFVGEGDRKHTGDALYLDGEAINTTNAFNSTTSGFNADPNLANNLGIDIQNHNVGTTGLNIIQNSQQSAQIRLTSTLDVYYPSVIAFTTELYEPRVCYYIDSIKDQSGNAIFEDTGDGAGPRFTGEITNGEEYTYNIWISNMAQSVADLNLETALLVQVYMETNNFDYSSGTIRMNNIGVTSNPPLKMTDAFTDDLAEYNTTKKTATFRVGVGANGLQGGTLEPTVFTNNAQKAYAQFKGRLDIQSDAEQIDLLDYLDFKASFKTGIVTISPENAQTISQCRDIDSSATVGGVLGAFNVVNENGGVSAFDDKSSPQTYLVTQVANKNFNVKIISLNAAHNALQGYSGDVNLSLIQTPDYGQCNDDDTCKANLCDTATPLTTPLTINFPNTSSVVLNNFAYPSASRNVTFKISYNNGTQHACSLDKFAIRPEKFTLSTPAFLRAGKDYNISLVAQQYNSTQATLDYNVSDVKAAFENLDTLKTIYNPDGSDGTAELNGTLKFVSTPFGIYNGVSSTVGLSFDDVGVVNIKLVDANWSDVDISNGDTPANCSPTGAYVCGEVNATFIPDHFTLTDVELHDHNDTNNFTYFSNDLNQSAKITLAVTAKNFTDGNTTNFKIGAWENPVNITFTAPQVNSNDANKTEIIGSTNLGFENATKTINDTNTSMQLNFNYQRATNTPLNPVEVNGTDITVQALSTYTDGTTTENVTGSNVATQNATFIYGRTHAPNQIFTGNTGDALIYYEAYCHDTDSSGTVCNKTLLPNGIASTPSDDPRWFINTLHTSTSGTAGSVNKKGSAVGSGEVTGTATSGNHQDSTTVSYDGSRSYPYKTTMENNASNWLLYNRYNPNALRNEFNVEFTSGTTNWSGLHESNTTSTSTPASWTNRRVNW